MAGGARALLAKEKEATRARDALAAERRRLPRVRIDKDYVFEGPDGKAALLDLFEGRRQLLLYHFMFGPNQDAGCDGCSMFIDQVGHLGPPARARHVLRDRVARADRQDRAVQEAHGLDDPVVLVVRERLQRRLRCLPARRRSRTSTRTASRSASASSFATATSVFRTYFTTTRGVEALGSVWTLLDLTPLGRQEEWEDSPAGYPQSKPYEWWRRHDEYESAR